MAEFIDFHEDIAAVRGSGGLRVLWAIQFFIIAILIGGGGLASYFLFDDCVPGMLVGLSIQIALLTGNFSINAVALSKGIRRIESRQ